MTILLVKKTVTTAVASILTFLGLGVKTPTPTQTQLLEKPAIIQNVKTNTVLKSHKAVAGKAVAASKVQTDEYMYLFAGKVACADQLCGDAAELKLTLNIEGASKIERKVLADKEGTYMVRVSFKAPIQADMKWAINANVNGSQMSAKGSEKLISNKVAIENLIDLQTKQVETQKVIA